jgi:F-type H+-transporting ATPase subunit b
MELNWTTFLLESVNFIVLIWLLQHFFYSPVKKAIEARKQKIEAEMQETESIRRTAAELEEKYTNRISEWEKERDTLRSAFLEKQESEKKTDYTRFQEKMAGERENIIQEEKRKGEDSARKLKSEALNLSLAFVSKLLTSVAGPDLETKLISLTVDQLRNSEDVKSLRESANIIEPAEVICISAFPIMEEQRQVITQAVKDVWQTQSSIRFEEDPELISGVEIKLGSYVIQGNLKNELNWFLNEGAA